MIRCALTLALILLSRTPSFAQAASPCPKSTIGWALSWSGPITAALYDSQAQLLYIIWYNKIPQAFYPVPITVMQQLSNGANPVPIYNTIIINQYQQILLSQKDNCPLSWEAGGGYLFTGPNTYVPPVSGGSFDDSFDDSFD